jgi:hypothetical protein
MNMKAYTPRSMLDCPRFERESAARIFWCWYRRRAIPHTPDMTAQVENSNYEQAPDDLAGGELPENSYATAAIIYFVNSGSGFQPSSKDI